MIPKKRVKYWTIVKILLFTAAIFFAAGIAFLQYFIAEEKNLDNKIYPYVFVDNKEVGKQSKEQASIKYQKINASLKNVEFTIVYKNQPVATISAKKINLHSNGEEIVERAYLIGRSEHAISRAYQKITSLFRIIPYSFNSKITYDKTPYNDILLLLEEQYNKPAKNALFTFENGRVVNFRQDERGVQVDIKQLRNEMDSAILGLGAEPKSKVFTLADSPIEPEITLKNSNNFGIEELIGEGTSIYEHSTAERTHNLSLAATKFHGVLLPKNKAFSFNDVIGDISSLTGYKQAYIIKNGRTVLGDGGGVCQVSTTLFRAALNAGLPIIERTAHAYRPVYYEFGSKAGFDATVFSPSVDLKIKNNTPSDILIMVENDKDKMTLKFKFYGKRDGRTIEITDAQLYDQQPPPPASYQDDPTLKKGVTKQIDFAAWGATAYFSYKVTNNGQSLFEKKFYSFYRPWQAIYLVGTAD